MPNTKAYAAPSKDSPIAPWGFDRRHVGPKDVRIDIAYCGICHSDIHQARDEWGGSIFPMVPGHEIVGHVTDVGPEVTKFKKGDLVGVGCMVDSCRTCASCTAGEEQYCDNGQIAFTYNGRDKQGRPTYGGYSDNIVVTEDFVLRVSDKLNLPAVAPLLCAGITTYSPLKHWNLQKGQRLGVVGLGGLGHMALKFGHAFGAKVTQFTTSPGKEEDARKLGADEVVVTKDPKNLAKLAGTFDLIIDTVAANHDINLYLNLLKRDCTLVQVGVPEKPLAAAVMPLAMKRRSLAGSAIGGIAETQEMLDFCAEHGIVCDIEMTTPDQINEAYERVTKNDVKYRFVIDMKALK